jgi:hypothetical protein
MYRISLLTPWMRFPSLKVGVYLVKSASKIRGCGVKMSATFHIEPCRPCPCRMY